MDIISNDIIKMEIYALLSVFFAATLAGFASADIGLLVEFPNGTVYTECISVSEGANAYQIFKKTDLEMDWSDDGVWGRALCMIDGIGSSPAGDGCADWSSYWSFSLAMDKDNSWTTHTPVGFTAGGCWNRDYETPSFDGHYCAKDGDVLGFEYTDDFPSGYPKFASFDEICPKTKETDAKKRRILRSSAPYWRRYATECGIEYSDYITPQNLIKKCEDRKAELVLNNTTVIAEGFSNTPKAEGMIYVDYSPKVITDLSAPFNLSFYSNTSALSGVKVLVNNASYTTNEKGVISLSVTLGDYLIDVNLPGFKEFRRIFRIGG